LRTPSEGSASRSQYPSDAATFHIARQILTQRCASRSDTVSSIILRHVLMSSSDTVRGSQSPNTGLMRRQHRHQSSRLRGFLFCWFPLSVRR
jgi:hypothetical protein